MAFFFSDFFDDSNVQEMNHQQIGMYWDLLRFAWNSDPPCTLPAARDAVRRILKYPEGDPLFEDNIELVLRCFRPNSEQRLVQKRLLHEYAKASRLQKARVKGGKRSRAIQMKKKGLRAEPELSLSSAQSVSDSGSVSVSDKKIVRTRARATKTRGDQPFTKSPLAKWADFRNALADWPEEKARFYFDLFIEKEQLNPGKYAYSRWDLAARAWQRKNPNEWKHGILPGEPPTESFDDLKKKHAKPKGAKP